MKRKITILHPETEYITQQNKIYNGFHQEFRNDSQQDIVQRRWCTCVLSVQCKLPVCISIVVRTVGLQPPTCGLYERYENLLADNCF